MSKAGGQMHTHLAGAEYRNGNRLPRCVKARIAHAIDHDRIAPLSFRLNHQCDRFRERQTVLEFALHRCRATE